MPDRWLYHPPYQSYRCCFCGKNNTEMMGKGGMQECNVALFVFQAGDEEEEILRLWKKVMRFADFHEHIALGLEAVSYTHLTLPTNREV